MHVLNFDLVLVLGNITQLSNTPQNHSRLRVVYFFLATTIICAIYQCITPIYRQLPLCILNSAHNVFVFI